MFYKIPKREPWTPSVQSLLWKGLVKDWKLLNPKEGNLFPELVIPQGGFAFSFSVCSVWESSMHIAQTLVSLEAEQGETSCVLSLLLC